MGFLKKLPTATIVLILFAVSFIVWGFFQVSLSKQYENLSIIDIGNGVVSSENEGKNVCATGKLEIEVQPSDDQTGFTADSAALIKTVEMYQYYIINDEVCTDYFSKQRFNIKGEKGESYKNPSFPEGVTNKVFFAKAKIGDIVIGEEFLNELVESNVITVGDTTEVDDATKKEVERKYLENISLVDYVPCDDGYFKKGNPDKDELGDYRVRFEYIDMDALGELSICGCQKDGMLVADESTFNKVLYAASIDEVENTCIENDHESAGVVFFGTAGVFIFVAVLIFVLKSRKGAKV